MESFDRQIIDGFKSATEKYCFAYFYFSDDDGRNKWNCISSAVDWIGIAISGIDFRPEFCDYADSDTIFTVLTLIMRVAMIKEGIEQIHRVLYHTTEIYLGKDCTAFRNKIAEAADATDNEYFEMLRACFGAHPMNLGSLHKNDKSTRRFAGRPLGWFGCFAVMVYPNQVDGEYLTIPIPFDDLYAYAKKRYDHLCDLTEQMTMIMNENMPLP